MTTSLHLQRQTQRTFCRAWIFATPELHFWHHSRVAEESNHNYGSNVIIWDVLFGTRFLPGKDVLPQDTGLVVQPPRTFVEQLLWPFSSRVLEEPAGVQAVATDAEGADARCVNIDTASPSEADTTQHAHAA